MTKNIFFGLKDITFSHFSVVVTQPIRRKCHVCPMVGNCMISYGMRVPVAVRYVHKNCVNVLYFFIIHNSKTGILRTDCSIAYCPDFLPAEA